MRSISQQFSDFVAQPIRRLRSYMEAKVRFMKVEKNHVFFGADIEFNMHFLLLLHFRVFLLACCQL
jgi:hypothetical protein